jgi:hypothetical protein
MGCRSFVQPGGWLSSKQPTDQPWQQSVFQDSMASRNSYVLSTSPYPGTPESRLIYELIPLPLLKWLEVGLEA